MSQLQQIYDKLLQVINWQNSVTTNSKTNEELPVQETINPASLVRVSIDGVSQSLIVQKIIDAARSGLNGLGPWAAGIYATQTGVIYNDRIYIIAGSTSLPFTSVDFNLELADGKWILPMVPSTVELVESPNTVVFDLGNVTDLLTDNDFVDYINTNGDQYDMTNTEKTYYFRFVNHGIDYLYSYNSEAGDFLIYGLGSGNTMLIEYLNLFFNSTVGTGGNQNMASVLAFGDRPILTIPSEEDGTFTLVDGHHTKSIIVTGNLALDFNLNSGVFPIGAEIQITNEEATIGLIAELGVTILGNVNFANNSTAVLKQIAADVWRINYRFDAQGAGGLNDILLVNNTTDQTANFYDILSGITQIGPGFAQVSDPTETELSTLMTGKGFSWMKFVVGIGQLGKAIVRGLGAEDDHQVFQLPNKPGATAISPATLATTDDLADPQTLAEVLDVENVMNQNIDADGNQIDNLANATDPQQAATLNQLDAGIAASNAYTDSQVTAIYRPAGDWDASGGTFPAAGSGTGTAGAIRRGDTFNVIVAGTIGGVYRDVGDTFYANIAVPGQTAGNWSRFESNTEQATEASRGTVALNSQAEIEDENSTLDTKAVTAKKFWLGLARLRALAWTWAAKQTFTLGIRISNVTASQYLKTDGSKDVVSVSGIPAADITGFNAAALAAAPAETLSSSGSLINSATAISSLVDADHVGVMDSGAANVLKKWSWLNIKANIKTYLDAFYAPKKMFIFLSSTYTLTSQTPLQKLFNVGASGNGAFQVDAGVYEFEAQISLSSLSSTSGYVTSGFLGTATLAGLRYQVNAIKAGLPTSTLTSNITVATAIQVTNASVTTTAILHLTGQVRFSAAGTFQPAAGMSIAAAAIVDVNSWFRLQKVSGTYTDTFSSNVD